ncbi:hypothetical protein CHS0354_032875 [Potamilus streckersoni]|uniref:CDC20/Fizzy WD40 domain-containing protein n=1 Tax=Potamilus streckersoni TaxID=2493646 RepID=A0AAE0W6P4_9BIVA|nr:hypothetical protein CHS0354_032875 [Potamilus streckersoni]
MSHFSFENVVSELTRLDAPIQNGPMMRWQRKALESAGRQTSSNIAVPLSPNQARSTKTPGKTPKSAGKLSSGKKVTPGKSGKKDKVPAKTPSKTPGKGAQCRFIPNRSTTDVELSHYAIFAEKQDLSPSKEPYQHQLTDAMNLKQVPQDAKILCFQKQKAPTAEGHNSNLKVLYSSNKCALPKTASTRQISTQPDRILDAPELLDDYYLNLLHWSSTNFMAVALGNSVYIWNASTGTIVQLMEIEEADEYVSCVRWVKEGTCLAVGLSEGKVQLWDAGQQKLMRTMTGHSSRIGTLDWNSYICSSGSRSGLIMHHDVRVAEHIVANLSNHTQEVCGLSWSPDGRYLASGGNDNLINIWDASLGSDVLPVHTFTHHQAAVKALSWCPWQPHLLASGGGTADRHIRFWNVGTGSCLNSVDAQSQVCSILWSTEYKELISGHGYSQNQLTIWKYPNMIRVADLTGHTARVLCLTMSPDGTTVASAAADETIRLWKCFSTDKFKKQTAYKNSKETQDFGLRSSIR